MGWKEHIKEAMEHIDKALDDNNISDEKYKELSQLHEQLEYSIEE